MTEDRLNREILNWLHPTPWRLLESPEGQEDKAVVTRVLEARGFDMPEKRYELFDSTPDDLPDPFLFRDMEAACRLIGEILGQESPRLLIFGDYDADGLTAAALLARYFKDWGQEPFILIPDRFDDGYGLSSSLVDEIELHRPDLVITVDTGTSSPDSVCQLKERGIEVVVTDHHQATAASEIIGIPLINPSLGRETFPYKQLSGAGVALFLTLALDAFRKSISPIRPTLFSLAAVGTIADVVPLTGANRIIVRQGLALFGTEAPEGLKAVHRAASLDKSAPSARDIAFSVAPRLNAAGRMGDVRLALDLLLEDEPARADRLASDLDQLNRKRRQAERCVYLEALKAVLAGDKGGPSVVAIAAGKGWHAGVLGIVSSRLVENLRMPAMTLIEENGRLTGSARSFGRIDLIEAISSARPLLEKFGGHAGAAGLTLKLENLPAFRERMNEVIGAIPLQDRLQPYEADIRLPGGAIDLDLVREFDSFEPTGTGFERPLVWLDDLTIESLQRVGEGRHLKLVLRTSDPSMRALDALLFGRGDEEAFYSPGQVIDVLAIPEINSWRNQVSVQLRLLDLRPAGQDRLNREASAAFERWAGAPEEGDRPRTSLLPTLSPGLFTALWQLMTRLSGPARRTVTFVPVRLAWLLSHRYNIEAGALDILLALAILREAGLIQLARDDEEAFAFKVNQMEGHKPALSNSSLWRKLAAWGFLKA